MQEFFSGSRTSLRTVRICIFDISYYCQVQLQNSKINFPILNYVALIGKTSKTRARARSRSRSRANIGAGVGSRLRVGDRLGGYIVEEPGEPGEPPELAEPGDMEGPCKLLW